MARAAVAGRNLQAGDNPDVIARGAPVMLPGSYIPRRPSSARARQSALPCVAGSCLSRALVTVQRAPADSRQESPPGAINRCAEAVSPYGLDRWQKAKTLRQR